MCDDMYTISHQITA